MSSSFVVPDFEQMANASGFEGEALQGNPYATLRVGSGVMVDLCQQMAMQLEAGVPLISVIRVLGETESNRKLREFLERAHLDLSNGLQLAEAFAKEPTPFATKDLTMIEAGLAGGFLPKVFDNIARAYGTGQMIQRQVRAAAAYPAVVLLISLGLSFFLLTNVVPQFARTFIEAKIELPALTQALLDISNFVVAHTLLSVGCVVGLGFGSWILWRVLRSFPPFQNLLMRLPFIGRFLRAYMRCQFFLVLGQLEQSGVPLLRSLAICETLHPFEVYQTTVHSFASATRNGSRLSAVMVESDIFGARAAQLVQTGETSGHLGPILAKVGARIEEELLHEIRTVTSLFEPCLVVILALVIGTMVAALFLPIFQLATAV